MKIAYKTKLGVFYNGLIEEFLEQPKFNKYKNKFSLILTSPPFPLLRKKRYGNLEGEAYLQWISSIAEKLQPFLTNKGSIVIEIGNSWERGQPIMSTLPIKAMLSFLETGKYFLCQQFVWHNSAKLPSPAQWVNVERKRVKDTFTNIWWMSKTPNPKANNKRVLIGYSDSMKRLLKTKKYNAGSRPSEHQIGKKSFLKNNRGAIPANVLIYPNTKSNSNYSFYCKRNGLTLHPARMPEEIPEFFINFLTNKGDLVFDPFAGSNTTGAKAEKLGRRWVAIEPNADYIKGSKGNLIHVKNISNK
ncbi:MAG TPA: site-specific DNA-methyltransferase [Chitinophagaceae bacterium]|jgi:site-specific DNA-methyltransferase (cytosine-N4-specific)|nr:site-specific DNA-methyltransferase [Chitinophagaceae bacterium]